MIILSDIHANLTALNAVINDFKQKYPEERDVFILGDIIDYGMRPNECIETIIELSKSYNLNGILGNHENAILLDNYDNFSENRGVLSAKETSKMISENSKNFLNTLEKTGMTIKYYNNKLVVYVHGSVDNLFWGTITTNVSIEHYKHYNFVISGHNHVSHYFKKHFETDNKTMRNKKFVTFINPGSVGQPRNHNSNAQYAYVDFKSETVHLNSVEYDITLEQNLYDGTLDNFYKERLNLGI